MANPLEDFRWSHRLILVFGPGDDDPGVSTFRASLRGARCELEDRDIVVGWIFENGAGRIDGRELDGDASDAIRARLRAGKPGLTVLLIGKDGGVKGRYDGAPALEDVFALIDGMPMRRAEMRTRGADCEP